MSATGYCEGVPMNVEELNDITDKNNWFKAIDEEVRHGRSHLYVHHLDVRNAFLHGVLKDEIFMQPPVVKEGRVLKLNITLYGVKQDPREWNSRFDVFVKSLGFSQYHANRIDICIHVEMMTIIYLLLYIDDFLTDCY
ncbi:hypothetical protein PR048_025204 [Dryococelus australis]|uniref:Reverse transcriptase Ty1/copia-type domain-containing protein n=1 Tax=Dryococelus australis TaxID=614101 RepID=A0ABQ9GQT9_9NEOP|nr:hypothetical protein PR048_025204 [Dryococelus australis]